MARRLGFSFSEVMTGSYQPVSDPGKEYRLVFHIDAASGDLWQTLRSGRVEASGHVEAEGLAENTPIEGFMIVKPVLSRFIRYEFDFTGDDGARYHYVGQKDIRHRDPLRTWTTLPGGIFDDSGNKIADSVLRFDLKTLGPFLRSFAARTE